MLSIPTRCSLAASTYPLEIIQLEQWLKKNPTLKDKSLAVAKQSWDPSIQALAALPDVVKRLADDIQWATDLGNAFLAQQADVMDAVQRMCKKAQEKGNLKSTEQQKVETKVVENKSVIVVEQSNPQVIYVPSYDPVVVYGPPVYPYPPIYYPPAGYYAAGLAISFGVGIEPDQKTFRPLKSLHCSTIAIAAHDPDHPQIHNYDPSKL